MIRELKYDYSFVNILKAIKENKPKIKPDKIPIKEPVKSIINLG